MEEFYKELKSSCEEIVHNLNPIFPLEFVIDTDEEHNTTLKISEGSIGYIEISDDENTHICSRPPCIMVDWENSKGDATIIAGNIFEKDGNRSIQFKGIEEKNGVAEQIILFIKRLCIQHTDIQYTANLYNTYNGNEKYLANQSNIFIEVWNNENNYNVIIKKGKSEIGKKRFSKQNTDITFCGDILINNIHYVIKYPPSHIPGDKRIIELQRRSELIPLGSNQMPAWYKIFSKNYNNEGGKQDDVRSTFSFDKEQWTQYFCDSSYQSSFVAAYNIVKNLLQNETVKEKYKDLEDISIADIGCGVGGATIGVISALEELLPKVKNIEIDAFDCSEPALQIFKDSIMNSKSGWNLFTDKQISFNSSIIKFVLIKPQNNDEYTFGGFSRKIANKRYDFTLCFKMVNELICPNNPLGFDGRSYYHICKIMAEHIKENGFAILLDIYKSAETNPETEQIIDTTNYNDLLRDQTRIFINNNQDYRVIVPIPCGLAENCECTKCSTYKIIRPSGYNGREFPASYRVMTMRPFAEEILNGIILKDPTMYTVMYTKDHKKKKCCYRINDYNIDCPKDEQIIDGYSI